MRRLYIMRRGISIHAPPRGATKSRKDGFTMYKFQFTPLREGRRKSSCLPSMWTKFQFTPLREGRQCPHLE